MTDDTPADDDGPIRIYRRLSPESAAMMRVAIAALGFPPHCSFKACRRTGTCATRDLLCWQVNHEDMNHAIRLAAAHRWREGPRPGEEWPAWPPGQVHMFERLLAEEAAGEAGAVRDRIAGEVEETTS
jgi:hypothetical protein